MIIGSILFFRHSENFRPGASLPQDFKVYHTAGLRIQSGIQPYLAHESSPYKYSPAALLIFQWLPKNDVNAWIIFKFLCLLSFMGSLLWGYSFHALKEVVALLIGIVLAWKGIIETLDYGQLEFYLLFFVVGAVRFFLHQKQWSGFLIGFLPWFKLPWVFLVIPFIFRSFREGYISLKHFLTGFIVSFLGFGILLPICVWGFETTWSLMVAWQDVLSQQPSDLFLGDMNQSIWSTALRWWQWSPLMGALLISLSLMICVWVLRKLVQCLWSQTRVEPLLEMTPWIVIMQLLNPLSWRWGSVFLVGAPLIIYKNLKKNLSNHQKILTSLLIFLLIVLWLFQLNPVVAFLGFQSWTDLHCYGLITFYWLCILLCLSENELTGYNLDNKKQTFN